MVIVKAPEEGSNMQNLNNLKDRKIGKTAVKRFLISKGYQILATDFWTNTGLIDLVVNDRKTDEVVFVLVEYLDIKNVAKKFKQVKISQKYLNSRKVPDNIIWFINKYQLTDVNIRLDVLQVFVTIDKVKIKHRKDVKDISGLNNMDLLRDSV